MLIFKHKRGLPFSKTCKWLNDFGVARDLTAEGITVTSQIRNQLTNELVADLTVTYPTSTTFKLRAPDTSTWDFERLTWDIHYHQAGQDDLATENMLIDVIYTPTQTTP